MTEPARLLRPARLTAAAIALVALAGLGIEFNGDSARLGPAGAVWFMARYFTNITNLLVVGVFGLAAIGGRWPGAGWPAASTVWIALTGLVYHFLLAATHHPEGIEVWSNFALHYAVPVMCLGLWLAAAPKAQLTHLGPVLWTGYPLAYAVYAIARGLADGNFPYFFLDPAKSGWPAVAAYVTGLGLVFVLSGSLLVALGRASARRALRA